MGITASGCVRVAADQQRELAVGLESNQAMEDLHASVFKTARPADIRGFVETRFEFNHNCDFLRGRRFAERLHDRRVLARAVQRLTHRDHFRIFRAGLDKSDYSIKGIEGMMKQDVVLANLFEDVARFSRQMQFAWNEWPELQVGPLRLLVNTHHSGEIHRAMCAEDLPFIEPKVTAQALNDLGRRFSLDLQPYGIAFAPVMQLCAH